MDEDYSVIIFVFTGVYNDDKVWFMPVEVR